MENIITLRLWSYDVWGNENDGWEVNDRSNIQTEVLETDLPVISRDLEAFLSDLFQLAPHARIDWTLSGDGIFEIVDSTNGRPLGQIEEEHN